MGAPRLRGGLPPLTVRLEPAAESGTARLALRERADDARVPSVAPAPNAYDSKTATSARSRSRGNADAAGIAPATDIEYYPAQQLDVYPALLAPLSIAYPERALIENRAGRALVMVMIDAAGRVSDAAVVEAEPPGYFEDAARKTFEQAAFSPARRNGMPVRSRVLIRVNFDPRAAGATLP